MLSLSAPIALFLLTLTSSPSAAEPASVSAEGLPPGIVESSPLLWDGYLVDLPRPPPTVLLAEVRVLRTELMEHRDRLDYRVGASKLTVPEVLVAIAVPGGSAYLIGKTAWRLRAKHALESTSVDLAYLDEDLVAFLGMSRVYVIALAQGQ